MNRDDFDDLFKLPTFDDDGDGDGSEHLITLDDAVQEVQRIALSPKGERMGIFMDLISDFLGEVKAKDMSLDELAEIAEALEEALEYV